MKRFAMAGFLTSSAVAVTFAAASMVLSGCVTEEVPPPEIHTSAYLVPDADSAASGDLPARHEEAAANNAAPQKNPSQATSATAASAPAAPLATPPVAALPPPPLATLPPPPIAIP